MMIRPDAMPTRLNATWSSVKVDVVMPQIIWRLRVCGRFRFASYAVRRRTP